MKIFISHNFKDKPIVEPIAIQLANYFGQNSVFYDSWSIQPGDGIVDKMNEALQSTDYFLFFVSHNSLNSQMVKMEWQSALYNASHKRCSFIPIKIDDCSMPPILSQNLYIDFCKNGYDIGTRQLMDVLTSQNTFRPNAFEFSNIVCHVKKLEPSSLEVAFTAERFMEPISRYAILFHESPRDIKVKLLSDGFYAGGPRESITLNNGSVWNGFDIGVSRPTVPGFPVRIKVEKISGEPFGPILCMKYETETSIRAVRTLEE